MVAVHAGARMGSSPGRVEGSSRAMLATARPSCLCGQGQIRTVVTAGAACARKNGRASAAATTAPTPSPSTSAARSTSSRRRSFSCPRRSGPASRTFWPASHQPRSHEEEEEAEEAAAGFNDILVSSARSQHVRVREMGFLKKRE